MMLESLTALFDQELDKLDQEVLQYPSLTALWSVYPGISNSGGNLVLHVCGNLRTFIGATLGDTGYIRNRDAEFTTKGLSFEEVRAIIASTRQEVAQSLAFLGDEALTSTYPENKSGQEWTTGRLLMHVFGHLQYHRGQLNYHRRFVASGWMF